MIATLPNIISCDWIAKQWIWIMIHWRFIFSWNVFNRTQLYYYYISSVLGSCCVYDIDMRATTHHTHLWSLFMQQTTESTKHFVICIPQKKRAIERGDQRTIELCIGWAWALEFAISVVIVNAHTKRNEMLTQCINRVVWKLSISVYKIL